MKARAESRVEGLHVYTDFLNKAEAETLLREIEKTPFTPAQSGKEKQHFGAKTNFKKKEIRVPADVELPPYAAEIEARMRGLLAAELDGEEDLARAAASFEATDVFVLRYWPERSSNLDLHCDDTFSYGELILDLSLESDTVLTLADNEDSPSRWVRVRLPARSLALLYGPARYAWVHGIFAEDVTAPRTSITLRTLSADLRQTPEGQRLLEASRRSRA